MDDASCIRCRYNLRTLDVRALCPECGLPVLSSLNRVEVSWTLFCLLTLIPIAVAVGWIPVLRYGWGGSDGLKFVMWAVPIQMGMFLTSTTMFVRFKGHRRSPFVVAMVVSGLGLIWCSFGLLALLAAASV